MKKGFKFKIQGVDLDRKMSKKQINGNVIAFSTIESLKLDDAIDSKHGYWTAAVPEEGMLPNDIDVEYDDDLPQEDDEDEEF